MSYAYIDVRPNPVTGIGTHQQGFTFRDFADNPQVERRRIGGPYRADFNVFMPNRTVVEDFLFLGVGREIKIYNELGLVDFGGMITTIIVDTGGSRIRSNLITMGNRLWARWRVAATTDAPQRSTKYNDTDSQDLYGKKEEVLQAGEQISVGEANQYAQKYLNERAWPTPKPEQISPGRRISERGGSLDKPLMEFTALGWWHTLGWIRYNQTENTGGTDASTLVNTIVSDSEIGQFIRAIDIQTNLTQITQEFDADIPSDKIIESIVDMGDSALYPWTAGVDHTREFYMRQAARYE